MGIMELCKDLVLRPKTHDQFSGTIKAPEINLKALQQNCLQTFIYSLGVVNLIKGSLQPCPGKTDVLVCGHSIQQPDKNAIPYSPSCKESERTCSLHHIDFMDPTSEPDDSDLEHNYGCSMCSCETWHGRMADSEDIMICEHCWFQEVAIRWFYFASGSGLQASSIDFDTKTLIHNPLPVSLFPELVEVSRKFNGQIYAWAGPQVILDWHENVHAKDFTASIGKYLINELEIPMPGFPQKGPFEVVVCAKQSSIKEVKLRKIAVRKKKKTMGWNNMSEVHTVAAREDKKRVDLLLAADEDFMMMVESGKVSRRPKKLEKAGLTRESAKKISKNF